MSQDNTPDRASDFDDDIPTYREPQANTPNADSTPKSVYERAGRVAPQSIPATNTPATNSPAASHTEAPDASGAAGADAGIEGAEATKGTVGAEGTEGIEAPAQQPQEIAVNKPHDDERSKPLASDAPTSIFDAKPQAEYHTADYETRVVSEGAPTTQYAQQPQDQYREEYRDTDFAPIASAPAAAAHTTDAAAPVNFAQTAQLGQPQEPLPGAAPASAVPPVVAPASAAPATSGWETPAEQQEPVGMIEHAKRGTIDFGIFLLRVFTGGFLVFDAASTFFGFGPYEGIQTLENLYAAQSYSLPGLLAVLIPAMKLAAGLFLLLGLVHPIAAAVATAVTAFGAIDALNTQGLSSIGDTSNPIWLAFVLALLALSLQFTGPGKISLDYSRTWAQRPLASSWIFAIVGIAGAVAMWWFLAQVNPL
ncbi:DoxX family membrane protein [Corynebacterium sp. 153RC1]|uniref:DoxX family membrane protein n=1 Tax=unclassified Corynebacterium TaxID=2624378 RepID=UPI00211CEA1A|nr:MULTISPECIES: DoxX family membrane protein [unclassified Corynebacterium]MCQ9352078.1 DoxX family membrane protein [Corynebacterium sp. 209RC1]MCQ9353827.1 DoxX family membrane protein [Corynebacterium sp. 1222RC1]MCQ9356189.1 DoxX family membrane protein [Corynebacterium sp. 122RC1]MCQ9358291.1 DoxX family membrane protein [Corynebacterium sp. 142RC1]MCQ9360974.1 DoxX family membrane protein [Corynebacterium sp. 153RC1]